MPLSREQLHTLARRGAAARIAELKAEISAILRAFPRVRSDHAGAKEVPFLRGVSVPRKPRRKRSKLSAVGRARIAAAQRKRWAIIKAKKAMGAGGRKRKGMSAAAKNAVSARMKKYWAERRKAKHSATK